MDKMIKNHWRLQLLSGVKGKVLEVGIGTGASLGFYPNGIELTGVDFSPGMLKLARRKISETNNSFKIQLVEADIQNLPFEDDAFDFIVSTCVFCSVPDPVKGFRELRRVCKPDGKIVMLEHMRSENRAMGYILDVFNPLAVGLWGANINRRTMENIEKAGLKVEDEQMLMGSIMRKLVLSPDKKPNG